MPNEGRRRPCRPHKKHPPAGRACARPRRRSNPAFTPRGLPVGSRSAGSASAGRAAADGCRCSPGAPGACVLGPSGASTPLPSPSYRRMSDGSSGMLVREGRASPLTPTPDPAGRSLWILPLRNVRRMDVDGNPGLSPTVVPPSGSVGTRLGRTATMSGVSNHTAGPSFLQDASLSSSRSRWTASANATKASKSS